MAVLFSVEKTNELAVWYNHNCECRLRGGNKKDAEPVALAAPVLLGKRIEK